MFRYVVRTLMARRASNAVAVVSIGLVIGASVLALAFYHGLRENMAVTGRADNVVVLGQGVLNTTKSIVPREAVDQVAVLPEVAVENGVALVSPESHLTIEADDHALPVRGVEPIAFQVHDQVKIVEGRAPAKGSNELLIGRRLVGQSEGLHLGGTLDVNGEPWPVVGVFSAAGSALENEVWSDRERLTIQLKNKQNLCVVVRVRSLDEVAPMAKKVAQLRLSKGVGVWALPEREYYETTLGNVSAVSRAVAAIIFVLVLGAVFAAANTLHASLSGRMKELAALWVVGHKRRRLAMLIFVEALLLCAASALLACVAAASFSGMEVTAFIGGKLHVSLSFGGAEVLFAFALAGAIGLFGSVYPGLQVLTRKLVDDLS